MIDECREDARLPEPDGEVHQLADTPAPTPPDVIAGMEVIFALSAGVFQGCATPTVQPAALHASVDMPHDTGQAPGCCRTGSCLALIAAPRRCAGSEAVAETERGGGHERRRSALDQQRATRPCLSQAHVHIVKWLPYGEAGSFAACFECPACHATVRSPAVATCRIADDFSIFSTP